MKQKLYNVSLSWYWLEIIERESLSVMEKSALAPNLLFWKLKITNWFGCQCTISFIDWTKFIKSAPTKYLIFKILSLNYKIDDHFGGWALIVKNKNNFVFLNTFQFKKVNTPLAYSKKQFYVPHNLKNNVYKTIYF